MNVAIRTHKLSFQVIIQKVKEKKEKKKRADFQESVFGDIRVSKHSKWVNQIFLLMVMYYHSENISALHNTHTTPAPPFS